MAAEKRTTAYDAFNAVDSIVGKPVVGSDGAKTWQNFQESDKGFVARNTAPTAPLKRADRASGIDSWKQEREIESQARGGKASQGYTHFKKRADEGDISAKKRKQIESRTRPEDAVYYFKAEKFGGYRKDYVFTTRNGKTGYYWDGTDALRELRGENLATSTTAHAAHASGNEVTDSTITEEPAKKKKKQKKPKAPVMLLNPNHPLEQMAARQKQAVLPHGWQAAKDTATGKTYYYNRLTSQRQWEPPESRVTSSENSLPDGWSETQDAATGRVYFYHAATQETRWDCPE